jgi:UDP-GlcNAc:undecaprenyl-phosphate GlcNAc-1-phosphate transferase
VTVILVGAALAAGSFAVSVALCGLARTWAPRFGLLDRPGGHKGHRVPTPLGGGVAIWLTTVGVLSLAIVAGWVAKDNLPASFAGHATMIGDRVGELAMIIGLATVIMVVGLLDDRYSLDWRFRLGMQLLLATILAYFGVRITLFAPLNHPVVGGTLTVVWIVVLTNAFNLLDNMDGLAASVGCIAAFLFAGAQFAVDSLFAAVILIVLVGALLGFLVHNRYPARLFMGDAGSNFLGFMLGACTVAGTYFRYDPKYSSYSSYNLLAPLLVMAVPLYDTTSVIVIRQIEGRSWFQGDRRHFSHRLVERGLTPPQAVRTIDLVTLASGLGALLLHKLDATGAGVVVAQTVCLLGVVAILEVSAKRPVRGETHAEHRANAPSEAGSAAQS